ncbi:MAG: phosphate/phosphite/phosphonate ABC transporter substrate-binding protein [Deltaproteobacteria bacterium]|nr:phosphate/phosphite/phosphonate ABC transporter substrate-binding protein [Deltaproteobacteria bacterium]
MLLQRFKVQYSRFRCRPFASTTITLTLSCLFLFALSCQESSESALDVRLKGPIAEEYTEGTSAEKPIRFALASVVSPELSTISYARFSTYLTLHLHQDVEIVRRKTYSEINELLRNGSVDAGLVCTGAYAKAREDFGLKMLMVPVVYGSTSYQAYIITRADKPFESIDDLKGSTFAFSDPLSNTGYRYIAALLLDRESTPDEFFQHTFFTYSHDNTIQAVHDGIADAGVVDSLVWDQFVLSNQGTPNELAIVQRSEEFPINPIVVSPKANAELANQLKQVLLDMPSDPAGRQALSDLGITGFSKIPESDYDPIVASWRKLGVITDDPPTALR